MKKLKPCNLKGIGIDLTEDELESTRSFIKTFKEFCEKWHLECSIDTLRWYFNNADDFIARNLE